MPQLLVTSQTFDGTALITALQETSHSRYVIDWETDTTMPAQNLDHIRVIRVKRVIAFTAKYGNFCQVVCEIEKVGSTYNIKYFPGAEPADFTYIAGCIISIA